MIKNTRFSQKLLPALLGLLLFAGCSGSSSSDGVNALPKSVAAADETSAIQTLRTIASAQSQAKVTRGAYADFATLAQAGFLDDRFATSAPVLRGYHFTMKVSDSEFSVNADPQTAAAEPNSRSRHLYLDSSDNTIHVNPSAIANKNDPSL
jgi:hypothetical protein